jgi:hypothetical protein
MSFARLRLGALVAAASLCATAAYAADTKSGTSGMDQKSTSGNNGTSAQAKPHWASREVKAIDAKALTLSNNEQFRLTDMTQFEKDGKTASRDDVKPGDTVKMAYDARGKLAYADRIDITTKEGTARSMKSSSNHQGTGSAGPSSSNKAQ